MKKYFFILLSFIGFFAHSCKENITTSSITEAVNPTLDSIEVLTDSIQEGVPIPVQLFKIDSALKKESIPAGEPNVTKANNNVFAIESPGIKLVSDKLPTSTPGTDGNLQPEKITPTGLVNTTTFPTKITAKDPATTDAAYYNLQYLDTDQGLSSSYVIDIMEDSRGNLWVSTWATGVCMYDSRTFTNYNENSGLMNNYIWKIFEDSKGNIWFGSDGGGVSKYDGNIFISYIDKDGLSGMVVYDIEEDERGNIWFATNGGLTKYDGATFANYGKAEGLGADLALDLFMAENNKLLITTENGFVIFDGVLFTHHTIAEGMTSNETTVIFEDSQANIWIGTANEGITMFDGYTFFNFSTNQGLSSNSVTAILEDDYNRIWIGTANAGISIYNRSAFTHISRSEGLSSNTIRSIYQDSDMNIWIGTNSGLNKFDERSFNNYTDEQGLGGLVVKGICEDQYGNIWFGHANGVSKYTGQVYENYATAQGMSHDNVRAITQDYKGNLWFGTEGGGVTHYDGKNFTIFNTDNGMSGDVILSMYEDSEQNMWFGTFSGGLTKYDGENFYHLTMEEGLSSNTVRSICEDNDGNMWFGTLSGGLEKFDGENLYHYTQRSGLSSNTALSLMADDNNNIWVGTENKGINIIKDGKILKIGKENGLSNGIIWSMQMDYANNVWVGTEKGLDLIEINESNTFKITSFGKLDGLKGTDFYPNSVCLDGANRLWWGTGKAVAMLNLDKFERKKSAPKLSITDVLIAENVVDYRKLKKSRENDTIFDHSQLDNDALALVKFDSINRFTNAPSNIELPYDLNHLTIQFSANDWTAPHKIKYMHKLEGASNEWHTLTGDNKVVHSYLPEGKYVFHLKAIGEAEVWSETLKFNITVKAPWWRTIWAYIFYLLFAVGIIAFITTIRTRKLIQQRKLLEKLVSERTAEVVMQKELVESKNKEIIDSINYAKRIQRAILPSSGMVKRKLANALIFFKPKDIVAGDFYWLEEKNDKILFAAADCTGHGVPGAMVSLVCNNTLGRTVREFNLTNPALILNKVRDIVIESFTNSREEVKDGMDISLISLDVKTNTVEFAGANNNLLIISDGELKIYKGDRQPIGKYIVSKDFTSQEIKVKPGDTLYMFTDGYVDQFGGENGKKFKTTRLIQLLLEINDLTIREQKKRIEKTFNDWKGELEQVDDVCVIGVRI